MIKAIDTYYKGNYYRSRLEARYAVFFDSINLPFQYESEGFRINDEINYLPDFYIPALGCYFEVKPEYKVWVSSENYKSDLKKVNSLAETNKLIMAFGNPGQTSWLLLNKSDCYNCYLRRINQDHWALAIFGILGKDYGFTHITPDESINGVKLNFGWVAPAEAANRHRFDYK